MASVVLLVVGSAADDSRDLLTQSAVGVGAALKAASKRASSGGGTGAALVTGVSSLGGARVGRSAGGAADVDVLG